MLIHTIALAALLGCIGMAIIASISATKRRQAERSLDQALNRLQGCSCQSLPPPLPQVPRNLLKRLFRVQER